MNQQKRTNLWKTRHKILLGLLVCALVLQFTGQQRDTVNEDAEVKLIQAFVRTTAVWRGVGAVAHLPNH